LKKESKDLLVEIGLEELPHSFIPDAMESFRNGFTGLLTERRIAFGEVRAFSTPRRMALILYGVAERQEDYSEEKRGPSVENAWSSDGKTSKALEGFLKANKATVNDVIVKGVDNRDYVFVVREMKGSETYSLLPEVLNQTIRSLNFPKNMKWELSGFRFARPIRWILFLFGDRIVPFSIADISGSNLTWGHRSYTKDPISIGSPGEYEEKLFTHSVIADRDRRIGTIEEQIQRVCSEHGLAVPDLAGKLYEMNTDLTEYPHAVLCEFERSFLELPGEVLTSEMIEHQFYFPLVDERSRILSNRFVAVSNIRINVKSRSGYERVLRARLDDGRFFYNEDKKKDFASYSEILKTVTFHEKLGSMQEKVERIVHISGKIADRLAIGEEKRDAVLRTARLCKNDLVTHMVGEFPGLQGIMGAYYARAAGYSEEVANGIQEHYYPRFATDALPSHIEGAIVGIADRLDTIMGIFSIGPRPTGSKDPFALRRRVFGIVKILISLELNVSMRALVDDVITLYVRGDRTDLLEGVHSFFIERIRSIFSDMGFAYDEINASLSGVMDDIYEAYRRVEALHRYRERKDFQDLLISFRRMGNILKDEEEYSFSEALIKEKEEKDLYRYFVSVKDRIAHHIAEKNYEEVYGILSSFKPYADSFFDNVLVMEEDLTLRANRIALLKSIISVFSDIIDISKIVLSNP